MCTSYEANPNNAFETFSLFPEPRFDFKREIYKDYVGPIFRRFGDRYSTDPATFGIVPRSHISAGVKLFDTMNARVQTIAEKRSFSSAWKKLQLCLIPCGSVYEPSYESGKPVRWKIGTNDGPVFCIAGLRREWNEGEEGKRLSFTMLTLNADGHPLMNRFRRPGAEQRQVVIVPPAEYENWLGCRTTDEARSFLSLYPADSTWAEAYPGPPRKSKKDGELPLDSQELPRSSFDQGQSRQEK